MYGYYARCLRNASSFKSRLWGYERNQDAYTAILKVHLWHLLNKRGITIFLKTSQDSNVLVGSFTHY